MKQKGEIRVFSNRFSFIHPSPMLVKEGVCLLPLMLKLIVPKWLGVSNLGINAEKVPFSVRKTWNVGLLLKVITPNSGGFWTLRKGGALSNLLGGLLGHRNKGRSTPSK